MHIKTYCSETESPALWTPVFDSWRPQAIRPLCSRGHHKQSRWYLSHCVPGRHPASQDTDKEIYPRHRTQDPDRKSLVTAPTLPSSQIPGHLSKVTLKIQSLSLLAGSSSDRPHKCRLFWFQK